MFTDISRKKFYGQLSLGNTSSTKVSTDFLIKGLSISQDAWSGSKGRARHSTSLKLVFFSTAHYPKRTLINTRKNINIQRNSLGNAHLGERISSVFRFLPWVPELHFPLSQKSPSVGSRIL